ncbi:MAG TPA: DUF58 domain-containing protein [Euzebyales bacterium]
MLPVVTRRLAVLAAVGAPVALVGGLWWVLAYDVLLLAAATADWLRTPRPARVDVRRDAPDVLTVGATGRLTWTVANPGDAPLRVALADELDRALGAPTRRAAMTVPPRGRAHRTVVLHPSRRGHFTLGRVTVRVCGPWGLIGRQRWRELAGAVIVYPRFRSRTPIELRLRRALQLQAGDRAVRLVGAGLDFDSLRDYTVDDEVRRIDWAATARSPRAVVRTYRAERNQVVLILVDCGRTMATLVGGVADGDGAARGASTGPEMDGLGADGISRLEHAIDAAQGVTRLATGLGDRVGMLAFADRVLATLPPRSQTDQLRRLTLFLAAVEPQLVESDYRTAFTTALAQFPRRALVIVLSELANEAAAHTLLPALGLMRRRHLVVVGAVRDPVVERWSSTPATGIEEVYRQAAAIHMLERRRATAARLRAAGATVVDAAPGALATTLADAYTDVKARGRL